MSWRLLDANQYNAWVPEWDRLNHNLFGGHPLLDSRFVEPLLTHFGKPGLKMAIYQEADATIAMALLQRSSWGIWRSFLPPQAQVSPSLIPDPEVAERLARSLPRSTSRLDLLNQDTAYPPFHDATIRSIDRTPHLHTMAVATDGSFSDYWNERPRKLRNNAKRWLRKLTKEGLEPELIEYREVAPLFKAYERYADIENKGWKGTAGTAIRLDSVQGYFYRAVLGRFAKHDQARMFELRIGDEVVASRIVIQSRGLIIFLKTTYLESYSKYAVGRILLYMVLEHLFHENNDARVEFYTNANADQLAWATGSRMIDHVSLYPGALAKSVFRSYNRIRGLI